MNLIIQCVFTCLIFTAIVVPTLLKDPLLHIMSYPAPIRRRVEELPQYAGTIKERKRRHIAWKIAAVFILGIILAIVAYLSGVRDFISAFRHVFILFLAGNLFDVIVLDLIWFCHSKRARIPGTEDMDKEYRNPRHHIRGGAIGLGLGAVVSLISGGIVSFISP